MLRRGAVNFVRNAMSITSPPVPKPFTVALIQLGNVTASKESNLLHAQSMIQTAAKRRTEPEPSLVGKPDLIVLPECFNSPYGFKYFAKYAEKIGYTRGQAYDISASESDSVKMLSSMARETGCWILGGSIPESDGDKLYNTSTVYNPKGELVATHRKVHLFDIDIPGKIKFKESDALTGGTWLTYFDTEFARIGLGICYDIRFPELGMIAARQGCSMMFYPAAFNLTTGPLHWKLLQQARAVDNQIYISMCSPARNMEADYHAWGHSMVVDPMGEVVVEAGHEEEIVYANIDPAVITDARNWIPVTSQRRFDVYPDVSRE